MPSSSLPFIVITGPPGAPKTAAAAAASYAALVDRVTRAPRHRSPLHRVISAPVYQRSRLSATRPAPAPPVSVDIRICGTDDVVSLRVPQSSTLAGVQAQLRECVPASARSSLALALDDDSVEGWALATHFHAFLAQAGRNGEPLRLVLQ